MRLAVLQAFPVPLLKSGETSGVGRQGCRFQCFVEKVSQKKRIVK
jgi:hypothetical protein